MARLVTASLILFLVAVTPAHADPVSIGVFVAAQFGYLVTAPLAYLIGGSVLLAAGIGASLVSASLNQPNAPSPVERQAVLRQSVGPRRRYYGRVKVGGTVTFFENRDGYLYTQQTMNEGLISGVVAQFLNDTEVTLDSGGYVQEPQFDEGADENGKVVRIFYKMGEPNQTVHSQLESAFTEVTANHRLRGVANALAIYQEVDGSELTEIYPNLNPTLRTVLDASIVKSVRTGANIWSDNPADVIYDYLTARDGAGFAYGAGYQESQINLESFRNFAEICDQSVPLAGGGSIKRYRLWDGFSMNEQAREVLTRFSATCDGDLYLDTDGKIAIRGGVWSPPQLVLDMDRGHIISADFRHGQSALAAFNELTITYTEPSLDFQETECDKWIDSANIALRGQVLSEALPLQGVPHFAQARRLGKIYTHKRNPEFIGTIVTNFYGLNAIGEETVRIRFPLLGIDHDFLVTSIRILDDATGVELSVSSLSSSAYDWDPLLEEGAAPGDPPDTSTPISLDPPQDINASAAERPLGGSGTGVFLVVTWTRPERRALAQEVEYRSNPGGTWISMSVSDGAQLAESGLVNEGQAYDIRVRTRSPAGSTGDWSPVITLTATPNTSPAADVTDVAGLDGVLSWTMSPDSHSIGARIYRNTVDDAGSATLIATVYGSPGTPGTYVDTPPAGVYYYWIASWTGSFVEGGLVPTGALTVG